MQRFAAVMNLPGEPEPYLRRAAKLRAFFLNYQAAVPSIQAMRILDLQGNTLLKVKENEVIEPASVLKDGKRFVAFQGQRSFFRDIATGLAPGLVGMSDFELGQVTANADFCPSIVQGLLDFGRPRPPTLEPVEVPSLVKESIRLLASKARSAGVTIELRAAPDTPMVLGDKGQLQQVLVNLLLNAIEETGAGARIGVTLEAGACGLSCRVENPGEPLNGAHIERIFEPFYTTKQERQGIGLGLSISYSIIQRHGGDMGPLPREGGGLVVWFRLPLAPNSVSAKNS
ncbi:MAG: HAMP domain-containing sensor histidine kinase [Pseudomonadota bacterium]|nr:HAMP domain-containing sensor histidine kinase [Pseudomonadota bacterium]